MSSGKDDEKKSVLSLVAHFDDLIRQNSVLNDGYSEQMKQMEWVRSRWASAEAEVARLQTEFMKAHHDLSKWEAKFARARKLVDGEQRKTKIVMKNYGELIELLDTVRDLLCNDNQAKLNDDTLEKLSFLNSTAHEEHNASGFTSLPELYTTGMLLSKKSYSGSEEEELFQSEIQVDFSIVSTRGEWVPREDLAAQDASAGKKRRSSTSSTTKTVESVELQGGKVLATATTTLTSKRAPTNHEMKLETIQLISESSDEAPPQSASKTSLLALTSERAPTNHEMTLETIQLKSESSDEASPQSASKTPARSSAKRLKEDHATPSAPPRTTAFVKQMEWIRNRGASAEAEVARLQTELMNAYQTLSEWEAKFAGARKLLDFEKKKRKIAMKKYGELIELLDTVRDLLCNDNQAKLNDETLKKLSFFKATAHEEHNARLTNSLPDLYSTGDTESSDEAPPQSASKTSLLALTSERAPTNHEMKLETIQLISESSDEASPQSASKTSLLALTSERAPTNREMKLETITVGSVELQGGKVLATATTTLTSERAPTNHEMKLETIQLKSESSDEASPQSASKTPARSSAKRLKEDHATPSAPPRTTETDTASDTPMRSVQRTPSAVSAAYGGSARALPDQHIFLDKQFFKRETCGPCGKPIKFEKEGIMCVICLAQAHPECRALLPLTCVPPGAACRRNNAETGCISDFAPSTPPMVPVLLVHCINEVENRGLSEQGLYRVNAEEKDVKQLKERFLRGCGSPQLSNVDIHVLCGCIKDFLRSLREPLVSNALWSDFMEAARLGEPTDAAAAVVHAVSQLPPPNRDTLAFLVLHLHRVAESPECEMGIDNLAKVFGPTVVGYGMTQADDMYIVTEHMVNVMQLLLRLPAEHWAQWAFPHDAASQPDGARVRGFFFSPVLSGTRRTKKKFFF